MLSIPVNRAMFLGEAHGIGAEDLDRYANDGTRTFVAAYGASVDDPPSS